MAHRGGDHRVRARRRGRRREAGPHRERDRPAPAGRHALHPDRRPVAGALVVNATEEHLATRRSAGLFDFSFMGLYEFGDVASAQAAQTRELRGLRPGQIAYTLILNGDGGVFNDATVW